MKTTILILFVLCATAAFCQSGSMAPVLQSEPTVLQLPSHEMHASLQGLAAPQYLNGSSGATVGRGVKPLWEFHVPEESVSLGEIARQLRQDHLLAKKAQVVFSDQR